MSTLGGVTDTNFSRALYLLMIIYFIDFGLGEGTYGWSLEWAQSLATNQNWPHVCCDSMVLVTRSSSGVQF